MKIEQILDALYRLVRKQRKIDDMADIRILKEFCIREKVL